MEFQDAISVSIPGSRKRAMLPHELYGKFSAKSDFVKYFRDNLQLYIPPDYMM